MGIYRQKPGVSGNGYACIGVNQTCWGVFFQHTRGEEKKKNKKKGASLRGINRKFMFQDPRL